MQSRQSGAFAMPVGSCKLKLGVEKRDADNVASAMALGPKVGPRPEGTVKRSKFKAQSLKQL
jgi:hypothetical protein